jgi:hypothetical protein
MLQIHPQSAVNDGVTSGTSEYRNAATLMKMVSVILRSWTGNGESDPLYNRTNFPPSINEHSHEVSGVFKYSKGPLTFLSDTGSIFGCILFIISCLMDLSQPNNCGPVSCYLSSSLCSTIGCFFFFVTPLATFILNDAGSLKDISLTVNISLYMISGACFTAGALCFAPYVVFINDLGAAFYFVGSIACVIAVIQDFFRAYKLHQHSLISRRKFMVEFGVISICLLSSITWTIGSLFFFSFCYHLRWGLVLFAVGSFFYGLTAVSGHLVAMWRYVERVEQIRKSKELMRRVKGKLRVAYSSSGNRMQKITRTLSVSSLAGMTGAADRTASSGSNTDEGSNEYTQNQPATIKRVQSTASLVSAKQIKKIYCAPTRLEVKEYHIDDNPV